MFAQVKQPILIGWLSTGSREANEQWLAAFKEGMAALGWKEGSNFVLEERWAEGRYDRHASLAEELAAKKAVIIVTGSLLAVAAAVKAAPNTPIVMGASADPVGTGFVASLARPGGMITGVTGFSTNIGEKYLELLLAAAPKLKRIGFLADRNAMGYALQMEGVRRSVARHAVEARFAEVANREEIEPAISRLRKEGAQALVLMVSPMFNVEVRRVMKLALAHRWPVIAGPREFAEEGAILSYGSDYLASYRRAAYYVDRILKGAKPGDLPIEQPTKFELVVNLKTAKVLGITIPSSILVRADKVIE